MAKKSVNYISPLNKSSVTITFKCDCGSDEFIREQEQKKYTHFEGCYNCSKCKKEHDYMSSCFNKNYRQQSLFN